MNIPFHTIVVPGRSSQQRIIRVQQWSHSLEELKEVRSDLQVFL
jgi:hypothetical protein